MEKILQRWPKQLNRSIRFDQYLEKRLSSDSVPKEILQQEQRILQDILDGKYEKQYPLSLIKQYLPGKNTYKLLDTEGQEAISGKRSPFSILKGYMFKDEKLRN